MTLLQTAQFDMKISHLKKELDKSGLRKELKLKAIPKKSERLREKIRLARVRRRKREKMPEGRDPMSKKVPSWKFIRKEGDYFKVSEHRKENEADMNRGGVKSLDVVGK